MVPKKSQALEIPAPKFKKVSVQIKGISPLVFHRFSEKAKKQIQDKQGKKAKGGRAVRNPQAEYKASYYYDSSGKIVMPPRWFKTSMVGAARFLDDVPMTLIRGAIFVHGNKEGWIPVKYKEERMREDVVKIGRGTSDFRYRGELIDWEANLLIEYDSEVFSAEQVLNLLMRAGLQQGVGEMRPEQKSGDMFGRFEIVGGESNG